MHRKRFHVFSFGKGGQKWFRGIESFATDLEAVDFARALTAGRERVAVVGKVTQGGMRGLSAGLQEVLLPNACMYGCDDPDLRATARQKLEQNQIF